MDKKELRKYIRERKRQLSREALDELSLPVISHLLAHPAVIGAHTILMYYSLPDEVNTHEAVRRLAESGKRVLLPRVVDDENMEIRQFESMDDLSKGSFGIMEPTGKLFLDYGGIDVAVIPGMSFDRHNNRLGRGKGYYDRFLVKVPDAYKIGVCFDFQKLDDIPVDGHDMKVDFVI